MLSHFKILEYRSSVSIDGYQILTIEEFAGLRYFATKWLTENFGKPARSQHDIDPFNPNSPRWHEMYLSAYYYFRDEDDMTHFLLRFM